MSIGQKIYYLRKEAGYTQEYLAKKLSISLEEMSKIEDDLISIDVDKLRLISNIFNIQTTDLINETSFDESKSNAASLDSTFINNYIKVKAKTSILLALAVLLFLLSPVFLIFSSELNNTSYLNVSENLINTIGFIIMFILITIGTSLCITCLFFTNEYKEQLKQPFSISLENKNNLLEKEKQYKKIHFIHTIVGTCILILSIIPLIVSSIKETDAELEMAIGLLITFCLVGLGVFLLVRTNSYNNTFSDLLNIKLKSKKENNVITLIQSCLWLVSVAVYLLISFITNDWHITWIIFVIPAFISAVLGVIENYLIHNYQQKRF